MVYLDTALKIILIISSYHASVPLMSFALMSFVSSAKDMPAHLEFNKGFGFI